MNAYEPGEVWQSPNGDEWYVVREMGHDEPHMIDGMHFRAPSSFIEETYGPLTRVYSTGGVS